jgi:hypothetical protein
VDVMQKRLGGLRGNRLRPWGWVAILVFLELEKISILSAFLLLLALFAFEPLVSLSFYSPSPCSVHPF